MLLRKSAQEDEWMYVVETLLSVRVKKKLGIVFEKFNKGQFAIKNKTKQAITRQR